MKQKKRDRKQCIQNCPICGDKNIIHYMIVGVRMAGIPVKPNYYECGYCGFRSESAFTVSGARKKWNKCTSIVSVNGVRVNR